MIESSATEQERSLKLSKEERSDEGGDGGLPSSKGECNMLEGQIGCHL
jgi:hypothetical protein